MMPIFKVILNYIVRLNFVISISGGLLISGVAHLFYIENYVEYGLFGFCSTFCVYNGQRLFKANLETKTSWLKWVKNRKIMITLFSLLSGLLACCFFIDLLNDVTLIIVLVTMSAGLISFFYVVKLGKKNIRELPHLKIHSIALTWTSIIVIFPIVNESVYNTEILLCFIPVHYLYFVAVTIPFDIRDLKYDSPSQQTIPQVIGVKNAKAIAIILLIIIMVTMPFLSDYNLFNPLFVIAILVQIVLVVFTTEKQKDIYYSLFIDGAISLLGISYLMI